MNRLFAYIPAAIILVALLTWAQLRAAPDESTKRPGASAAAALRRAGGEFREVTERLRVIVDEASATQRAVAVARLRAGGLDGQALNDALTRTPEMVRIHGAGQAIFSLRKQSEMFFAEFEALAVRLDDAADDDRVREILLGARPNMERYQIVARAAVQVSTKQLRVWGLESPDVTGLRTAIDGLPFI